MKELNWFQKKIIKLKFSNKWLDFNKNFPNLGQNVKILITFNCKYFGERCFISENFEQVINENDKQEQLDLFSIVKWKPCKSNKQNIDDNICQCKNPKFVKDIDVIFCNKCAKDKE